VAVVVFSKYPLVEVGMMEKTGIAVLL